MNRDVTSINEVQLQVPSSWQIRPLKSVASFRKGLSILKTDLSDEGVRVISYGQIHDKSNVGVKLADGLLRYIPQELTRGDSGARLRYGDLVFADTSEDLEGAGNAVFVDTGDEVFAGYHTVICRLHDENVLPKFLAYVVNSECWRSQVRRQVSGVKVFSITQRILSSTYVQFPDYPEQQRIVQLLDVETAKIDQAMSLLRWELETMEQLKKSLIYEAVTKGLDPTVPMKPSGVEWIGDIPEHWRTTRIKYIAPAWNGLTYDPADVSDTGTPVLRSGNIQNGELDLQSLVRVVGSIPEKAFARSGDILICSRNGSRNLIGKNALIRQDGYAFGAFMMIARPTVNSQYFYYLLNSGIFDFYLPTYLTSTVNQLTGTNFGNMIVPITDDLDEQLVIVEELNTKCKALDVAMEKKCAQLSLLRKERDSVIFEYVTGKRRVSEVA